MHFEEQAVLCCSVYTCQLQEVHPRWQQCHFGITSSFTPDHTCRWVCQEHIWATGWRKWLGEEMPNGHVDMQRNLKTLDGNARWDLKTPRWEKIPSWCSLHRFLLGLSSSCKKWEKFSTQGEAGELALTTSRWSFVADEDERLTDFLAI